MQTISRYLFHDTISPFPLCVDVFITAILIYDMNENIFYILLEYYYNFIISESLYILSCTWVHMKIFVSINNGKHFLLEGEKHDLIRLSSPGMFWIVFTTPRR